MIQALGDRMKVPMPRMLPAYAGTNLALVVLGYEAASSRTIPHWAILAGAIIVSVLAAFQWSQALARAYRREDQLCRCFKRYTTHINRVVNDAA